MSPSFDLDLVVLRGDRGDPLPLDLLSNGDPTRFSPSFDFDLFRSSGEPKVFFSSPDLLVPLGDTLDLPLGDAMRFKF